MKKCIFLDRDGTINEEVDYLSREEDIVIMPGVAQAINILKKAGYIIIIITNQSGIARGYLNEKKLISINNKLCDLLKEKGAVIDDIYYCPHHPSGKIKEFQIECDCRKPKPGLIYKACLKHEINLQESFAIGDKISDVQLGKNAGCHSILLLTGHGKEETDKINAFKPDYVASDLLEAANWIIKLDDNN